MLLEDIMSTSLQDPPQDDCNKDRIIELPGHRHEVRHEVQGHGEVSDEQEHWNFPCQREAAIGEKPFEEYDAIRHEPS